MFLVCEFNIKSLLFYLRCATRGALSSVGSFLEALVHHLPYNLYPEYIHDEYFNELIELHYPIPVFAKYNNSTVSLL